MHWLIWLLGGTGAAFGAKKLYENQHFVQNKSYDLQFFVNNPTQLFAQMNLQTILPQAIDGTSTAKGLETMGWRVQGTPVMAPAALGSPLFTVRAVRSGATISRKASMGPLTITASKDA
jgi:hypothetical protein